MAEVPGASPPIGRTGLVLGLRCRVIDIDSLIAAKTFAGRDKDKATVKQLEVVKQYRERNPGIFDGT